MTRTIKRGIFVLVLLLAAVASLKAGETLRRLVGPKNVARTYIHQSTTASSSLTGYSSDSSSSDSVDNSPFETFQDVYQYVRTQYVDPITHVDRLAEGAVNGMILSLDNPLARYMKPQRANEYIAQENGAYQGVAGVYTISKVKRGPILERRLEVMDVAPGGPGAKAGLEPGDIITEIDQRWVIAYDPRLSLDTQPMAAVPQAVFDAAFKKATKKLISGITLTSAMKKLTTNRTKPLTLVVQRGAKSIKITLTPTGVQVPAVTSRWVNPTTLYVGVHQFAPDAISEVGSALDKAKGKARSIIVDLRDNPGGAITPAIDQSERGPFDAMLKFLSWFVPGGQVGYLERRSNWLDSLSVGNHDEVGTARVVVLVNKGTSNLAEFAADVLRTRLHAKLVGDRTFGQAIIQKFVRLSDGSAVVIPIGELLVSPKHNYEGVGLTPDVKVASGSSQPADVALKTAIRVASGGV